MKTAIVHDVFIELGGAEKVLYSLLKIYPEADIFIPLVEKKQLPVLREMTRGKIITSFLNKVPFFNSASIFLKPLIYIYWELIDLSTYDLVISSSHSFSSKSVITGPNTFHVSYIHTPPRYLYTEFNETQILKKTLFKILLSPLMTILRMVDFMGAQRPDVLIANSKTVQNRIRKYYRRESLIIYPPISALKLPQQKKVNSYYVCLSRLAKQKGIELAIRACKELNLELIVIGTGGQEKNLKKIAGNKVNFVGYVSEKEKIKILSAAKALIYCSIEEDFGIVPIEAMSCGIPVIAYNSGAVSETVLHKKTGFLFNIYSVECLKSAIIETNKITFSKSFIKDYVDKFKESKFTQRFLSVINKEKHTKLRIRRYAKNARSI